MAGPLATAAQGRQRHLAEVALGGERVEEEAVAHLSGDLGHALADPGEEHGRRPVLVPSGEKNGVMSVWV